MLKENFIQAIHEKKLVEIKFVTKSDKSTRVRKCVPFDFGYSTRDKNKVDKYQLYDLNSPNGKHNLALEPEQLITLSILNETFNPADYITWDTINWTIRRDWGVYS